MPEQAVYGILRFRFGATPAAPRAFEWWAGTAAPRNTRLTLARGGRMARYRTRCRSILSFAVLLGAAGAQPTHAIQLCTPMDTGDTAFVITVPRGAEKIRYTGDLACSASARQRCDNSFTLTVPPGYQMCKVTCRWHYGNHAGYDFQPTGWFSNDAETPPRFTTFIASVHAEGDSGFFDTRGSNANITDITMYYIPASVTNAERRRRGCVLPNP